MTIDRYPHLGLVTPALRASLVREVEALLRAELCPADQVIEAVAAPVPQQPTCSNCKRWSSNGECSLPRIGTKQLRKTAATTWCIEHSPML